MDGFLKYFYKKGDTIETINKFPKLALLKLPDHDWNFLLMLYSMAWKIFKIAFDKEMYWNESQTLIVVRKQYNHL